MSLWRVKTHARVGMQPHLVPAPPERAESFSLCGRCTAACVEDVQRVIGVARENDVVELFACSCGRLEDQAISSGRNGVHRCGEVQLLGGQFGEYRVNVLLTCNQLGNGTRKEIIKWVRHTCHL